MTSGNKAPCSRRRWSRETWTFVVLLAVGCASDGALSRAPEPSAPPKLLPEDGAAALPPANAKSWVDASIVSTLAQLSRLRGLAPKGPVKGRTISREEMVAFVERQLESQLPAGVLEASEELLFALGVVPESFDYRSAISSLMRSQLAGFYDPVEKTMFVGEDLGDEMERRATLSHELVHALQDQHFDLGELLEWRADQGDRVTAIHAFAEGDATSAMFDALLEDAGKQAIDLPDAFLMEQTASLMELSVEMAEIPGVVKRSLMAQYVDGMRFVHFLRRRGGWAEVDRAWADRPASTEQLLHPEKFLSKEAPLSVPLPNALAPAPAAVVYHDVFGEQAIRILFQEWMPWRTAEAAAEGWGGDRIAVFRQGDRHALAWHLRYDNEVAAKGALVALARGLLRQPGEGAQQDVPKQQAEAAVATGELCRERGRRGPWAIARSGRDVALVAGPYRRNSGGVAADADCSFAIRWVRTVLRPS